ncbi:MAG: right-handed parallel beta-helix repeat-containing protein [Minicystis sp.]
MRSMRIETSLAVVVALLGCGGGQASTTGSGGGSSSGTGGAASGSSGTTSSGSGGAGGSAPSLCEPFGHYGAPQSTFTLPVPAPPGGISYPDIQASFKEVDWATLDRLYIPAGKYKYIQIGNLPQRDASRPLVITNLGGQVQVGPNDPGAGYIWAINGGSNWVLTGRYDPDAKTGDASFPGHRCGDYAGSRGKYGFYSDDAFAKGQYLHMGIGVGSATSFEIEYLEIFRSGFAGIRLLNPQDTPLPMDDVRIHDNYVHDVDGEGVYFGWTGAPPSNLVPRIAIYNNRFIRTGNEALQIQNLGDGSEVKNNVIAFAALHWRDNGLGQYQDNNAQVQVREGTIVLHHNIFMGGASNLLNFFSGPEAGDGGRHVTFHDNYFADTLSLGGYFGGTSGDDSTYTFAHNLFRGLDFGYDVLDPNAKDPGVIFSKSGSFTSPITFDGNTWEGSRKLFGGLSGPNGTSGNVTAMNNVNGPVTAIAFVQSGYPAGAPTRRLESSGAQSHDRAGQPRYRLRSRGARDVRRRDVRVYDAEQRPRSARSSRGVEEAAGAGRRRAGRALVAVRGDGRPLTRMARSATALTLRPSAVIPRR